MSTEDEKDDDVNGKASNPITSLGKFVRSESYIAVFVLLFDASSVFVACNHTPPKLLLASNTRTSCPLCRNSFAQTKPDAPAPTTKTFAFLLLSVIALFVSSHVSSVDALVLVLATVLLCLDECAFPIVFAEEEECTRKRSFEVSALGLENAAETNIAPLRPMYSYSTVRVLFCSLLCAYEYIFVRV